MHLVDERDSAPVRGVDDLRAVFAAACKPHRGTLVGMEHELHGVTSEGGPLTYEGAHGVRALFEHFIGRGWAPVHEGAHIIALAQGQSQITFEPGGQVELAAAPHATDEAFAAQFRAHLAELSTWGQAHDVFWLGVGLRPFGTRETVPWMPKTRYRFMREYMPTVGSRGLDMMLRTATVQANIDFASEAEAAEMLRALFGVTSVLTALFASSPIVDGLATDYQSYRAHIWQDTDAARCGMLDFVFARDDVFTAYAEWAMNVPMYFLFRDGSYQAVPAGLPFGQYLKTGHAGHTATVSDWKLHLSTLFPEVRMKGLIEVRGCDLGDAAMVEALGPLVRGLAYDATTRHEVIALTAPWTLVERHELAARVPREGLAARVAGRTVREWAADVLTLADAGLGRVAPTARSFLAPLHEVVATGRSRADVIRAAWQSATTDAARVAALRIV